jgi:acetyltransferase-like isoleucine patch superfamily enzyme
MIDSTALIADDVVLGEGVRVGAFVVIKPGTVIGAGVEIQDAAVLGKSPSLAGTSTAPRAQLRGLVVGDGAVICCGAVVFAGASVGAETIIGDQAYVRERAVVGERTVIGRGSCVDNDVRVGARVKIQTNVYLTAYSVVEDDVFVGPGVCTTNDDTMSRHDERYALRGATIRRAARVGGGAVLTPGVDVGEEAFVAAGAVVTADVAPRAVVMGVPARAVGEVPEEDLLEHWR